MSNATLERANVLLSGEVESSCGSIETAGDLALHSASEAKCPEQRRLDPWILKQCGHPRVLHGLQEALPQRAHDAPILPDDRLKLRGE